MKNADCTKIIFLIIVSVCVSCYHGDDTDVASTCLAVSQVEATNQCYDSYYGLTLTASGQSGDANQNQFVWSVFPQADTLNSINITQTNERIVAGSKTVVVVDSILKNSPKFVVKILSTCETIHKQVTSPYFHFVKRFNATSKCYIWQRQTIK